MVLKGSPVGGPTIWVSQATVVLSHLVGFARRYNAQEQTASQLGPGRGPLQFYGSLTLDCIATCPPRRELRGLKKSERDTT